jgi:glycerol-3-phosphate dehydrogenase
MQHSFHRDQLLARARDAAAPWDVLIIGGGATGVGIALDAASRGYRTLQVERYDFGKGTSSRSTKLIHGGVRYLQQGNISLVRSALRERGRLRANAPHLVRPLPFLVPTYGWWEQAYYASGLKLYDLLAAGWNLASSRRVDAAGALGEIPTLRTDRLRGGVVYYDAVFDDARLLINLVQTAIEHGAVCLNYVQVRDLIKEHGRVVGVIAEDVESGQGLRIRARVVINATGPFVDTIRQQDDPRAAAMIAPSQGIHLVVDASFLGGDTALIVPKTRDNRIVFAIPWYGRTLIGTTDTPVETAPIEPRPLDAEIDFLLATSREYLARSPERQDVLALFAGIRPLVRPGSSNGKHATAKISRDHTIVVSESRMITITGGKWTTYREMAQDCVDLAAAIGELEPRPCRTRDLPLHGAVHDTDPSSAFARYGNDATPVDKLVNGQERLRQKLDARLPYLAGEVIWSARHELARTVEDVLARRTRALLLDARAAQESAPHVAALLAMELGRSHQWCQDQVKAFCSLASGYAMEGANAHHTE